MNRQVKLVTLKLSTKVSLSYSFFFLLCPLPLSPVFSLLEIAVFVSRSTMRL